MSETYSDRHLVVETVARVDDGAVHFKDSWSFGPPAEHLPKIEVGREYLFECRGFNNVSGLATLFYDHLGRPVVDEWLWHRSDADLDAERAKWLEDLTRSREKEWERNRADWAAREAALPLSVRRRLDRFRANGGHGFETDGWGYELVCCELAVLYAASGQEDSAEVMAYAGEHGTSGNQHDYAKMVSRHLTDDPADEDAVANSVSALSPITGDADYSESPR